MLQCSLSRLPNYCDMLMPFSKTSCLRHCRIQSTKHRSRVQPYKRALVLHSSSLATAFWLTEYSSVLCTEHWGHERIRKVTSHSVSSWRYAKSVFCLSTAATGSSKRSKTAQSNILSLSGAMNFLVLQCPFAPSFQLQCLPFFFSPFWSCMVWSPRSCQKDSTYEHYWA